VTSELNSNQRVFIVGTGLAGLLAAESLQAEGFAGELVMVANEPGEPYNRRTSATVAAGGGSFSGRCVCCSR
jgi:monoamine oxidase